MHIDWQVQHAAPSETFLVLAELRIVNDVSTLERLGDPKLKRNSITFVIGLTYLEVPW